MINPLPLSQWLNAPRPDDTPVAWRGERLWTLGDLRHDVTRLVDALRHEGGDRWALCVEDGYLFIVALLATLHAGKTPVLPGHARGAQLDEQRALFSGILSDTALDVQGRQLRVTCATRTDRAFSPLPDIDETRVIELYTSGSTGTPQRVSKPVVSLDREARLLANHFGDRLAGRHVVASVVLHHLYGLTFRVVLPMALGLPLHASLLSYAEQLSALPDDKRYLFISSPAFLRRLDPSLTPPPVDLLLSAGGVLPWRDIAAVHGWLSVWPDEIYGSTETGVMAWRYRQEESTLWQPFPGVTFHGDRVLSPLIHEPEGIALDDILHFTTDGRFSLAGRRGRVVKIEDKRISLEEVERRLLALDGIREAAALAVTRGGRQGIGALLVLSDEARLHRESVGKNVQESAWRRALRPWLEPVAVPRCWRIVDEIPVNSMNKRVTAQLQELFHEDA
ncbi:acyl-CoA synthetase [Enterobacter cloacae complex sp. P40RS]|uniref:Acyl-CoA synthetase n=1 Tax=Enterobacter pasteurii TaxID=3029761 RepID=A0ABR9QAE3_9ENTR|nr:MULTISPECIES: acyl-CoA synthetase [Enterobacter cloacae complex]MBE4855799.1 acyl-CoA synthetase [Enterobacter pasteurii]MBE4865429.1 acyl-CoA synthetase [Enterobacter cloacae complex sp. P40C2]MBE4877076.1 acyl-CoA synthetase [Enterobacter cloacae complex sp. P40C]